MGATATQLLGVEGGEAIGEVTRPAERWIDLQNVGAMQAYVCDLAERIRQPYLREDLRESDIEMLDASLSDLASAIEGADLIGVVLPPKYTAHTRRFDTLLSDYKIDEIEVDGARSHRLLIPTTQIKSTITLPYDHHPIIELKIVTSADQPTERPIWEGRLRKMVTEPPIGSWFRLRLDDALLASFNRLP